MCPFYFVWQGAWNCSNIHHCMFLQIRDGYSPFVRFCRQRVIIFKCVLFILFGKGCGTVAIFTIRMFLLIRDGYSPFVRFCRQRVVIFKCVLFILFGKGRGTVAIFTIVCFTDKGWLFTFCMILPTKGGNIQVCTFYFVWQGVWNCSNIHHCMFY